MSTHDISDTRNVPVLPRVTVIVGTLNPVVIESVRAQVYEKDRLMGEGFAIAIPSKDISAPVYYNHMIQQYSYQYVVVYGR